MARFTKFNGEAVTLRDIRKRAAHFEAMSYPLARWMLFCETMLNIGYKVSVKETPHTHSKYVKVHGPGDTDYLVRFSDHKPSRRRELNEDCDFFVGVTHTGTRTTAQAIRAVEACFNAL